MHVFNIYLEEAQIFLWSQWGWGGGGFVSHVFVSGERGGVGWGAMIFPPTNFAKARAFSDPTFPKFSYFLNFFANFPTFS